MTTQPSLMQRVCTTAPICLALLFSADWAAATPVHLDAQQITITDGLNGTWRVTSELRITSTPDPHTTPVGGLFSFTSLTTFTGSATLYTPLFLPGTRQGGGAPAAGSDLDNSGVYETDWRLAGPAVFDYSKPWSVSITSNRSVWNAVKATLQASLEPTVSIDGVEVSGAGFGANLELVHAPNSSPSYRTIAGANLFELLLTPTSDGIGFFASGGQIQIDGWARDTALGLSTLSYDNPVWLSGEGFLVDDFTRANDPGMLTTRVLDENTSVPEPGSLLLALMGSLALTRIARRPIPAP